MKKSAEFPKNGKKEARDYSKRGDSTLTKFYSSNGQVYGTLTLDKRHAPHEDGRYPSVVRIAYDKKI